MMRNRLPLRFLPEIETPAPRRLSWEEPDWLVAQRDKDLAPYRGNLAPTEADSEPYHGGWDD